MPVMLLDGSENAERMHCQPTSYHRSCITGQRDVTSRDMPPLHRCGQEARTVGLFLPSDDGVSDEKILNLHGRHAPCGRPAAFVPHDRKQGRFECVE
jgi:hypothetical protein